MLARTSILLKLNNEIIPEFFQIFAKVGAISYDSLMKCRDIAEFEEKVYNVTLRSVYADEIHIFEIANLNDMIGVERSEELRELFVKSKVKIYQLTNIERMTSWTHNEFLVECNMNVRYISKDVYNIQSEILIFNNTIAVYNRDTLEYSEHEDIALAISLRDMHRTIWSGSEEMRLGKDGTSLTKQYKPYNINYNNIPVIIYPSKDDGQIHRIWDRNEQGSIDKYIITILESEQDYYKASDIILAIPWPTSDTNHRYADIWKININHYSNDSGMLYECRSYKELARVYDYGTASGNTAIIITAEELLLRDLIISQNTPIAEASDRSKYLPRFPHGYMPTESYYV